MSKSNPRAKAAAPAAAKWPPCLLWQSADGKPMGIAAAAYEEIKAMWREVYYWAERTLRAAGMDAGRLPEPIWLRPSNWSPEMVAGLLYANNETAYPRAAPEAPATPPRLRPEWLETLIYLEDGYPFAVDAGEVLRRCYVRELSQCGGAYDEECNVLWPLLGPWPQGADVDEERRAVIDIALAKHARNLARAMADGEAIANGREPRAVFREDELEAQERAAAIVAAAIERARKCAAPIGEPPRALIRARMLEWLALEVRDRAPAPVSGETPAPAANGPQTPAPAHADGQCKRITRPVFIEYLFARFPEQMKGMRKEAIKAKFDGQSKNRRFKEEVKPTGVKGKYPIEVFVPFMFDLLAGIGARFTDGERRDILTTIDKSTAPGEVFTM